MQVDVCTVNGDVCIVKYFFCIIHIFSITIAVEFTIKTRVSEMTVLFQIIDIAKKMPD